MSFLKSYKPLLNLYLVLGVCPFRVNLKKNLVECNIYSLIYTIIVLSLLTVSIIHFWLGSLLKATDDDIMIPDYCETGTCNYAFVIQALIIFALFLISSLHTIVHRSRHVQLLNEIVDMELLVWKHCSIEMFPNELVRKVCLRNSFLAMIYFSLSVVAVFEVGLDDLLFPKVSDYLFTIVKLIITLSAVDFIAICMIIKHCSQQLVNEIEKLFQLKACEDTSVVSWKTYQIFYLLDNLNEMKMKMCSVFGVRLLISQLMDFILLTVVIYYFILVNVPHNFRLDWFQLYFVLIYLLPVIFKNFALVAAADTLSGQVSR